MNKALASRSDPDVVGVLGIQILSDGADLAALGRALARLWNLPFQNRLPGSLWDAQAAKADEALENRAVALAIKP